jgi:hypothetical protein
MSSAIRRLWSPFGNCSLCSRKAFLAAATAWCLVLVAFPFGQIQLTTIALVLAIGLSLLWLTHLSAFALRASRCNANVEAPDLQRRAAFPAVARVAAFAALASVAPRLVHAATRKENHDYAIDLQQKLKAAGAYSGNVDGFTGPKTLEAIRTYKQANGLGDDATLTEDFLRRINALLLQAPCLGPSPYYCCCGNYGCGCCNRPCCSPAVLCHGVCWC